jgi:hypothetical protein
VSGQMPLRSTPPLPASPQNSSRRFHVSVSSHSRQAARMSDDKGHSLKNSAAREIRRFLLAVQTF